MATLVTGLFKARSSAERAVEDLVAHGWSRDDISLLMSDATMAVSSVSLWRRRRPKARRRVVQSAA